MKSEQEPISDDEWLLRRVRVERFATDRAPFISPNAFEPRIKGRDKDSDGISLYRSACLNDPTEILATIPPDKRDENGIVRIPVSLLRSMGLSVVSRSVAEIKGHVVIPELNADDYAADKARFTPMKVKLASEASKDDNIVLPPKSLTNG